MTKKERVLAALQRKPLDRFPAGELQIDGSLAERILGKHYPASDIVQNSIISYHRDRDVRLALDIDLLNVGHWPSTMLGKDENGYVYYRNNYGCEYYTTEHSRHIVKAILDEPEDAWDYPIPDIRNVDAECVRRCAQETDFFIFAQIGGPVSMLDESLDFEDFLVWSYTNTDDITEAARKIMIYEIQKAKLFLDAGADGIIIADDMAYNSGLFLPPNVMKKMVYPFYKQAVKEIKAYKDIPVVLHSDGNLNEALDDILDCGFDALQSLQPSAGMDILKLKKSIGDKITLWGNMDLDYLMTNGTPEEVRQEAGRLIQNMGDTGFILSTCNTLIDPIPAENAIALYSVDRTPANI